MSYTEITMTTTIKCSCGNIIIYNCPKCELLEKRIDGIEQELSEVKQELFETKKELSEVKQELFETKQVLSEVKQELFETKQVLSEVKQELYDIKSSAKIRQIASDLLYKYMNVFKKRFNINSKNVNTFYTKLEFIEENSPEEFETFNKEILGKYSFETFNDIITDMKYNFNSMAHPSIDYTKTFEINDLISYYDNIKNINDKDIIIYFLNLLM